MVVTLNQVLGTDLHLLVLLWAKLEKLNGCKKSILVNKYESSLKVVAQGPDYLDSKENATFGKMKRTVARFEIFPICLRK